MAPDEEILKPLKSFYSELISSLNLDTALKKLYSYPAQEGGYYYELAESAFKSIYKNFLTSISIEERAENLQAYIEKLYGDNKNGSSQILMEKKFHFTAPLDCHIQFSTVKEDSCPVAFEASKPSGSRL